MMRKKFFIYISLICILGLVLRLLWVLNIPTEQRYDFATYHEIAVNISNGLGHTLNDKYVAWQGPLYPYVLGFFYRITGFSDELTGKWLNIIFSVSTTILSWFVFKKLFPRKIRAAAAFTIAALLPMNIAYVNILDTEVFFSFLLTLALFLHLNFCNKRLIYPVIGVVLGLLSLTKPFMIVFPAILGLIFFIQNRKIGETFLYTSIIALTMFVVIAPWTLRNYKIYNRFILISYNAGYVQYINNNDQNENGAWLDINSILPSDPSVSAEILYHLELSGKEGVKNAPDLEPILASEAAFWIKNNFTDFLKLGALRIYEAFFRGSNDVLQQAMNGWKFTVPGKVNLEIERLTNSELMEFHKFNRNKNLVEASFNIISYVLTGTSVVFLIAGAKNFLKIIVKGNGHFENCLVFLHLVFFTAIVFFSEGQAKYAFPVYPFMIYAFIYMFSRVK